MAEILPTAGWTAGAGTAVAGRQPHRGRAPDADSGRRIAVVHEASSARRRGSDDTVVDGVTGRLWHPWHSRTAVGSLAHALRLVDPGRYDPGRYDPGQLRRHAVTC